MHSTVGFNITTSLDENESALLDQILNKTANDEPGVDHIQLTNRHRQFADEMRESMGRAQEEIDKLRHGYPVNDSQPTTAPGSKTASRRH